MYQCINHYCQLSIFVRVLVLPPWPGHEQGFPPTSTAGTSTLHAPHVQVAHETAVQTIRETALQQHLPTARASTPTMHPVQAKQSRIKPKQGHVASAICLYPGKLSQSLLSSCINHTSTFTVLYLRSFLNLTAHNGPQYSGNSAP